MTLRIAVLSFCCSLLMAQPDKPAARWWAHTQALAGDDLAGRDTGSEGLRKASRYVVTQFERAGLKPAGESGYYQNVPLHAVRFRADQSEVALVREGRVERLRWLRQITIRARLGLPETIEAGLVFAGYDWSTFDAKGKILVRLAGAALRGGAQKLPVSSNTGEVLTMFLGVLLANVIGLKWEGSAVVLPLLATQLLWINLATDGAPALALGVDPPDEGVMSRPPRPAGEPVITRTMWSGILFVSVVMAAGTLLVLDASLPGGLIAGSGNMRYAQTMAFTTLIFFQLFNVFNARSDERTAFYRLFANAWLWAAVGLAVVLQIAVVYVPALQKAFSTVGLSLGDWLLCAAVASSVLWLREMGKAIRRRYRAAAVRGRW